MSSFQPLNVVSTSKALELFHMDLFSPTKTLSFEGKRPSLIIIDDSSRYTQVYFLAYEDDTFDVIENFYKRVQNEKRLKFFSIRSDHGREFKNQRFESFCEHHGISHNFSCPRTPPQNKVVERMNKTL